MTRKRKVYLVNPDIIDRFSKGQTGRSIADVYGVSPQTIFRALRYAGIHVPYHGRPWTRDEERLVMRLKHERRTHREIADLMGRPIGSVSNKIVELRKVKRRPELLMRRRDVWYGEAA